MSEVIIRNLASIKELQEMQQLEKEIWDMETNPIHQTLTAAKNGGIVLGAYENQRMVGFLYSFPGFRDGTIYLCSHMLGIKPDYQKRKVGEKLKRHQYRLAMEAGYSSIVWTYDPLLSVNAYLNVHKLGAVISRYIENSYGEMTDALNAGLPSDRFLVEWPLNPPHSFSRPINEDQVYDKWCLLEVSNNKSDCPTIVSVSGPLLSTSKQWFVPIPHDFQKIRSADHELALDWRLKTRGLFKRLFSHGFCGVDFIKGNQGVNYYKFSKDPAILQEDEQHVRRDIQD